MSYHAFMGKNILRTVPFVCVNHAIKAWRAISSVQYTAAVSTARASALEDGKGTSANHSTALGSQTVMAVAHAYSREALPPLCVSVTKGLTGLPVRS